jgi:small subunit ribosomal protein S16
MVRIKLTQTGTKNCKKYRIIVIERRDRRDGKAIDTLGYYDPTVKPPKIEVKAEKVKLWLSRGAQPTDTVRKLLQLT